jgi:Zn-dependent metalloprotease
VKSTVDPAAAKVLAKLQIATNGQIVSHVSRETGVYDFMSATGTAVLASDNILATPEARARAFLSQHGGLVGMSDAERSLVGNASASGATVSTLKATKVFIDRTGRTHVKFDQAYQGLKVFGAQLIVHMNGRGITALNGSFVPGIKISKTPKVSASRAGQIALSAAGKAPDASMSVVKTELSVYRMGLLEGYKGRNMLAYAVEVSSPRMREQVWINAQTGNVINRIPLQHDALHRIVYSPSYDPDNPDSNKVREEGDPTILPAPSNPPDNLYHYTGQAYNLFASAFGRDSYDGLGKTMRTVYLVSDFCPNANWNGVTTNYCPDFDKDDIVAHEWGHAYTEYTHNLIYANQSGALNESYSDIFGETVDLNNSVDGAGGPDNSQPTTYTYDPDTGQYAVSGTGVRWRIGEDLTGLSQPAALGISRDMWFPEAFGDPGKVSSPSYYCGTDQSTAVHTNSAVPNHAYALLVDGTSSLPGGQFNGVAVQPIGFTKALAIYYRAMTVYQTSSTNFAQHEQAMQASCRDLVNAPINNFSTSSIVGTPSTNLITLTDCQQVENAMKAVEMSAPPLQCNFQKLLDPNTPAECSGSNTIFTEDWETGMDGWTVNNEGTGDAWPGTNWTLKSDLPANTDNSAHSGTAAFAINPRQGEPNGGTCAAGGDVTGHFWITSREITIPAGASDLKMAFEHFVQTEIDFDGGNVKISVNGGPFNPVPQDQYVFNRPNFTAPADNPLSGQPIWNGSNGGELTGSWGTTIISLSNLTNPGDKIKIRFDFGQDACNGNLGWFVDTVRLYSCPVLDAPTLSVGDDYENPDRDGRYTLNWTRPTGATGPDVLQESTSCGPVFTDDASEPLLAGENSKWVGSEQWATQPNPSDNSTSYYIPDGALQNESLTMKNAVTIPAGASSTLTFTTRQGIEDGFDFGHVEVSIDGTNFVEVANYTGPPDNIDPLTVFEGARTINLSQFAGQSIKVRFRMESDPFNIGQPAGWHIDNIAITATAFSDIASVNGTAHTFTTKPNGNYCYRVSTAYPIDSELAQSPFSNVVNVAVDLACPVPTNVTSGATASASSEYVNGGYPASSAIDGEHKGLNWGNNGGWNDSSRDTYPDWLEIAFDGTKTLTQIIVYTVQNNVSNPVEPTPLTPADLYGIEDFDVQYWDGDSWETVTGGSVTGNDKAMRVFAFAPVETTKIRVMVNKGRSHWSRITEVEALGCEAP